MAQASPSAFFGAPSLASERHEACFENRPTIPLSGRTRGRGTIRQKSRSRPSRGANAWDPRRLIPAIPSPRAPLPRIGVFGPSAGEVNSHMRVAFTLYRRRSLRRAVCVSHRESHQSDSGAHHVISRPVIPSIGRAQPCPHVSCDSCVGSRETRTYAISPAFLLPDGAGISVHALFGPNESS